MKNLLRNIGDDVVSLINCNGYDYNKVKKALEISFENLGGVEKYVKNGTKVLLKANLLMKKTPETATTTNPVFVQALAEILINAGAVVTIADSPGGPYTINMLKGVYEASGMREVAEKTGATLNYDVSYESQPCKNGLISRSFEIIKPATDADIIISVAKLKTHSFATYTGAVKNLFGVIPGTYKAEYHLRMPTIEQFSDMLVDLCEYVSPTLSFIDGIIGMEGAGPSAGKPRKIGVVIASENPHNADVVGAKIIGLKIDDVPTLKSADKRGLITDFKIIGDEIVIIDDFDIPKKENRNIVFKMLPWVAKTFSARPIVIEQNCIGCADCAKNCPAKAITMVNKKPHFDYNKCFRCYCCQELCPKGTIIVKRSKWILR